jgi:hypothetical protein
MTPRARNFIWLGAGAILLAVVLIFPRVHAFVALASREIRYLWWLILIAALAFYLAFAGRRK